MRILAVAILLVLAGCSTRRTVTIVNDGPDEVMVSLEESYGSYSPTTPISVPVPSGASVELWWYTDFASEVVIRREGGEIGRYKMPPERAPITVR